MYEDLASHRMVSLDQYIGEREQGCGGGVKDVLLLGCAIAVGMSGCCRLYAGSGRRILRPILYCRNVGCRIEACKSTR